MKQTYDDGHRKKPNNENRKSNSKSVFRLLMTEECVYQRVIRFPAFRKTKMGRRFPFFVFQF